MLLVRGRVGTGSLAVPAERLNETPLRSALGSIAGLASFWEQRWAHRHGLRSGHFMAAHFAHADTQWVMHRAALAAADAPMTGRTSRSLRPVRALALAAATALR